MADERKNLWAEIAWSLPAAAFAVVIFARASSDGQSQLGLGLAVGAFLIGKAVWDFYWPWIKPWLLERGLPPWCLEDGWRGNALISGIVATVLTLWLSLADEDGEWIQTLPVFAKFALIFGALFALTWVAQRIRGAFRLP